MTELSRVASDVTIETTRVRMAFENPADLERYLEGLRKTGLPEN